jgi:acetyltransferase-like isoleucine patch superfamily enzyme
VIDATVRFMGRPLINVRNGGRVTIASGAILNSQNNGYHLNPYWPVKLFAYRPGAVITVGGRTRIHGSCLHATAAITVGKRCLIAGNSQIMDNSGHDMAFDDVTHRIDSVGASAPVAIEDDVWIGAHCMVMLGVTIGTGTVVGAGSIVTRSLPPMVFAAGSPALVIRDQKSVPHGGHLA